MDNDLRALRSRDAAAQESLDVARADRDDGGSGAILAQTTAVDAYPTTAAAFFAILPCDIDGAEKEGAAATYVPRTGATAYALNLGSQVPPAGTTIVCHSVGGRWCFRYDSGG